MRQSRAWGLLLGAVAVVQVAAATGCTSTQSDLRRWQGRPITELIADRGEADRIMSYPFGGSLYIWEQRQSRIASGGAESARGGPRFEDVIMTQAFLVDEGGVITQIQSKSAVAPLAQGNPEPTRARSRR